MSPVHVVLVSLLVDELSGLFLIFFGWPKKIVQSQIVSAASSYLKNWLTSLGFLWKNQSVN